MRPVVCWVKTQLDYPVLKKTGVLARTGVEPGVTTPKAFADVIAVDLAKWSGLIQRANVRTDE